MYEIVLVPFPLTPISAFGYFLCQKLEMISKDATSIYHWRPNSKMVREVWQSDNILVLTGKDLGERLKKLIANSSLPYSQQRQYKRLLNFIASPGRSSHKDDVYNLSKVIASNWHTPEPALRATAHALEKTIESGLDPWVNGILPFKLTDPAKTILPEIAPSRVYTTLPVFDDAPAPNQIVIGHKQWYLEESNIVKLMNQHLAIVVGGPPGSGKSTATATLVDEMKNLVLSLKSRIGWEEFDISVEYVNLDLGTPVGEYILRQEGQDEKLLKSVKRKWTIDRAMEGMHNLIQGKTKINVIVADLPGKIDGLTRILSCGADGNIVLTRDWDRMAEWREFFAEMGSPHLAHAMTRLPAEGIASTVKRYRPGAILSGRITGLDRVVCSWDPFLHFLAKVLLFDLLPNLVETRQQTIDRFRLAM